MVETELHERLENARQLYIELIKRRHFMLADRVRQVIEDIQEEMSDRDFIAKYGLNAWHGISERDFL